MAEKRWKLIFYSRSLVQVENLAWLGSLTTTLAPEELWWRRRSLAMVIAALTLKTLAVQTHGARLHALKTLARLHFKARKTPLVRLLLLFSNHTRPTSGGSSSETDLQPARDNRTMVPKVTHNNKAYLTTGLVVVPLALCIPGGAETWRALDWLPD